MAKLPAPYASPLGFTTRRQAAAFEAQQPRSQSVPARRPGPAASHRQAETAFLLALALLLLVLARLH